MSGGSDSDVCTSKRPKTKLKISESVKEVQSDISSNTEDTDALANNKNKNVSSVKSYKKASKRSRESDEESSISTEEEIMSKKRVRKNSEEKFRPKKRVSAEARKRRETVRSVREKIIAALNSDSEDESESKVKSSFKKVSDKCSTGNSKSGTESRDEAENSDNIQNNTTKGIHSKKDEDSSSAYNSGSEGIKTGKKIATDKASDKSDKSDESELTDTDGDKIKDKLARKTFAKSLNSRDSESDFNDNNQSNNIKKDTKTVKNYSSENSCALSSSENELLNPVLNKVQNSRKISSSKNETFESKSELKKKKTIKDKGAQRKPASNSDSDFDTTKSKKKNKIETSAHKNEKPLPFSESCDSSSDDVPLSKSKIQKNKCITEEKNNSSSSEHHQIKSKPTKNSSEYNARLSSYRSDSEEEIFFNKGKPIKKVNTKGKVARSKDSLNVYIESSDEDIIKHKLKDSSKKGAIKEQKKEEISSCSSDDRSTKETETMSSKRNNPKVTVSSQKDMDSLNSSSEDDRPLKKTKSALGKSNTNLTNKKKMDSKSDSCHSDEDTSKERKKVHRKEVAEPEQIQNVNSPESDNKTDCLSEDSDAPLVKKKGTSKAGKETSTTRERECKNEENEESLNSKFSRSNKGRKDEYVKREELSDSESSEDNVSNSGHNKIQSNSSSDDSSRIKTKVNRNFSNSPDSDSSEENEKKHSANKLKSSKEIKKIKSEVSASSGNAGDSDSVSEKKKNKKVLGKGEVRINNYKKYINAAGIRVRSYAVFWEGCKNEKQRADKLLKLLEDHGVKGRPTLQKCKKIRAKIERKREIEELDLSNIIEDGDVSGRYKCRSSRRGQEETKKPSVVKQEKTASEATVEIKRRLSRIKTFADSDSSSD